MTISRMNAKIGKKGNATPHHEYICGINQYDKKQGVMLTQSGNMPSWAVADPAKFWQTADERERANGTTYKEHTLSLPRELTLEQQKIVVDRWIEKELGDKHPYTYAIHHAKAKDGGLNPHAHLMFSKRTMDGIERTPEQFFKRANKKDPAKGGAVKADTGMTRTDMRQELTAQRERWGEHLRECLKEFGLDDIAQKVDMRPWHERGLTEPPKNQTMAEIQKAQKLDTILENHPYYLTLEPKPPEPAPRVKLPITTWRMSDGDIAVIIGTYNHYNASNIGRQYENNIIEFDLGTQTLTHYGNLGIPKDREHQFVDSAEKHAIAFFGLDNDRGIKDMGVDEYDKMIFGLVCTSLKIDPSFNDGIKRGLAFARGDEVPPMPEIEPRPAPTPRPQIQPSTTPSRDFDFGM